jgi:ATP-dependent Clp protease, protease subunit
MLESLVKVRGMRNKPSVFISYAHADSVPVDALVLALQASGVDVWIDKWRIKVGDSIVRRVNEAIHESDFLIVVLSKASVKSKWVQEELSAATVKNIEETKKAFILPVLLEQCNVPELLRHRKYVNFSADPKGALRSLVDAIMDSPAPSGPLTTVAVSLPELIELVRAMEKSEQTQAGSKTQALWLQLLENHRVIYLGGQIEDSSANDIIAKLLWLNAEDSNQEVHFYVDSLGGSVTPSLAIYDTMCIVDCPIATYTLSSTGGMGTLLATAGTKGRRYALEGITLELHIPTAVYMQSPHGAPLGDPDLHASEVRRMTDVVREILQKHTTLPASFFGNPDETGRRITTSEALNFGIVDFVVPTLSQLWRQSTTPRSADKARHLATGKPTSR